MAEMVVEECGDLPKRLLGLGHAIVELVLGVRLTFVDFELRLEPASRSFRCTRTVLLSSRSRVRWSGSRAESHAYRRKWVKAADP